MLAKRLLIAFAAVAAAVLLIAATGPGRQRAALALAARLPAIGDAGDGQHRLVPRLPARGDHRDHAVRAGAARHHRGALQRARPIRSRRAPRTTPCSKWPGPSSRSSSWSRSRCPRSACCSSSSTFRRPTSPSRRPASSGSGPTIIPTTKFEFDSLMLQDKDRKPDQPRLLAVDNEVVVPVNKVVRVQVIGADVIHAFAVPSFGIKIDAVPGRLNETWFKADARRRLLRPVLGAVRQGSRLHADRGAGGEGSRLQRLGRAGQEEIRARRLQAGRRRGEGRDKRRNTR